MKEAAEQACAHYLQDAKRNCGSGRKSKWPSEKSRYAQCPYPGSMYRDTALNDQGIDNIEFLFDANKSDRFEPLKKVASGGELSRLMLCIKSWLPGPWICRLYYLMKLIPVFQGKLQAGRNYSERTF